MYALGIAGYSSDAVQVQTDNVNYINDTVGYYTDVQGNPAEILDYLISNSWGNYRDIISIDTGILDYLIDNVPFNIIIEQERGWTFDWELITTLWETIDNDWNNG